MRPASEAELSALLAEANRPLQVRGGGTRGMTSGEGDVIETGGLSGVTLYEPGALTLVVKAGTPLEDVEATLAAENQCLAFEPMDHRALLGTDGAPTIGGVVAANISGPRRVQVGACRDFLLGVRFVDGSGTVIRNGGRVMKNVTGYDLARLMAGSYGTLGVLTEVALKVLPMPVTQGLVSIDGLSVTEAVRAMSAALGSPFEVSGAARLASGTTMLRVEGTEASVAYRMGRLAELLSPFRRVSTGAGADWTRVRDVTDWAGGADDVWRLSVKPSDAPGLVDRLPDGAEVMLDWGGGLVWVAVAPGTDLREALGPFRGHATRVRGSGPSPRFQPEAPAVAKLSDGLRRRFDPRGILNPGLMAATA
ncbi:FAD-binding protein [Pelagovum pacificum]|uniref:FAD-binding protein n=1 Tax=Pelagovum pacificum TaxID=2588711 RepID=A0A5C5GFD8_9RHOB|nr:FAD-binding protein [Pelagovum pacificum]QQA43461.1 FAD-binding protein [Pelagovum pacificum]TNY33403.1 FAD-binding protein [Pelagovum pacificum]